VSRVVQRLLEYDPETRQLAGLSAYGQGLGCCTLDELVTSARELVNCVFLRQEETLCRELGEWLRYRAIFALLPEQCLFGRPREEKPIIRAHLETLGLEPEDSLVSAIKLVCTNFRAKRESGVRKMGIEDVRVRFGHHYRRILGEQNDRCCYCGVPFVVEESTQLDHVVPFYLGDDPTDGRNWRFCCAPCNRGKGVYPYYSLGGVSLNWLEPSSIPKLSESVRFAALTRDKSCSVCGTGPTMASLLVTKVIASGCWILDNVQTVCANHALGPTP
jgi:hypothetical protein